MTVNLDHVFFREACNMTVADIPKLEHVYVLGRDVTDILIEADSANGFATVKRINASGRQVGTENIRGKVTTRLKAY